MTLTQKGTKIVSSFTESLEKVPNLTVKRSSISRQVFELIGPTNCLLYVKFRSDYPLKWGVTANVVNSLKNQNLPWVAILLFLSHEKGYLLSSSDVNYYIKNVWPLGSDGDYKPAEGIYLDRNKPFASIADLIDQL